MKGLLKTELKRSVAIMQPYFFPHLAYFQLINAADTFVCLDNVQHIRRGWINRNRILLSGTVHTFTVPIEKGQREDLILDKCLSKGVSDELVKIQKTLEHAYGKADHGSIVLDLFEQVAGAAIRDNGGQLVDLLHESIRVVCRTLNVHTPIVNASSLFLPEAAIGQDRILAIVKALNGTDYINSIGGADLYSTYAFKTNGINLAFLQTDSSVWYSQVEVENFVPQLSIIDVIANLGLERTRSLLSRWRLVPGKL